MLDMTTLTLFAGACLALAITPGPDMLLTASRSVSQGRAAGFASLFGAVLGVYCHALAAALGLAQLLATVPMAYDAIRFAGAAYLFYLAWKTIRAAGAPSTGLQAMRPLSVWRIFCQGLLTNVLNPKMALFVLALFPQFISLAAGSLVLQMLVLATVLNVIGLLVNGVVVLTASRVRRHWQKSASPSRLPNYLLGSVFAGLACRLALASRN